MTNDALRSAVQDGLSQEQIADRFSLSRGQVSRRLRDLELHAAPQVLPAVAAAQSSVWDVQRATEENYQRCLTLLTEIEDPVARVRVVAEIRQHLTHSMQVLQAMYSVQEVQAFQEEVLRVLDECDPGLRGKILTRLRERRALRLVVGQRPDGS